MLVSSLVLVFAVYAVGVARTWRRFGYGHGISRVEALRFTLGWLALVVALSPALDEWSEIWLAAHMVQHELLMIVAAPLIAASASHAAFLCAMPAAWRGHVLDVTRRRPVVAGWRTLTSPLVAFLLHLTALWVWHLPALYDAALEHEAIHALQHLCFFGTATLFWWGIAHGRYGRIGYGAAVVYVFATAVHGGVLGALLTLSPRPWYVPYAAHSTSLTPLEDQQLAGLLMWIPAGLILAASGLALFAAWVRDSDRRTRFNPAPPLTPR